MKTSKTTSKTKTKTESKGRIFVCDGRIRSGRPILTKAQKTAIVLKLGIAARHVDLFYEKWIRLRYSSKSRGAECLLSFADYMKLAARAGIDDPDMIGKGLDKFQMGRKKDLGDYVMGSCRFITQRQNQIELTKNGGRAVGDAKRSKILSGRTRETHDFLRVSGLKKSKPYSLRAPSGKIYQGLGLVNFIRDHGLTQSHYAAFLALNTGKTDNYKGWTRYEGN